MSAKIKTENAEMLTVREAMRGLHALIAALEAGTLEKVILMTGTQMRAVILPLDAYADLAATHRRPGPADASPRAGRDA